MKLKGRRKYEKGVIFMECRMDRNIYGDWWVGKVRQKGPN